MSESAQSSSPEPQPDDPLVNLRSPEAATRRSAAERLTRQTVLNAPALAALEQVAITDSEPDVRQAALAALESPAARALKNTQNRPFAVRMEMLEQIEHWRVIGLLNNQQASALRLRYNYDLAPRALSPAAFNALAGQVDAWQQSGLIQPEQAAGLHNSLEQAIASGRIVSLPQQAAGAQTTQPPAGQPAAQPSPAAPRQSLQQVLFSEISIRIALYLGGFLIVAAALILAAVLEIARLPILLSLTLICGAAAGLTRTRLPLPSFVLFIIFASLLPIDAGVTVDLLKFEGNPANTYWAVILAGEAILLAGGALVYRSRLFSLAALAALSASAIFLATRLGDRIEHYLLLLTLVSLISAAWQVALKRRFEQRFILPLYWVTHLQTLLVLAMAAFTTLLYIAFTYDPSIGENVAVSQRLMLGATWLIALAYYLLSDLGVHRLGALPLLGAGAALFTPWIVLSALPVGTAGVAGGVALVGVAVAFAGNRLALTEAPGQPLKRYGVPLLLASAGILLWATGIGFIDDETTAFLVLLVAGGLYSALHANQPRLVIWLTALLALLAAYFTFFRLPFARAWQIDLSYQAAGAGMLLLFPDLLPLRGAGVDKAWLRPARALGALVIAINTLAIGLGWLSSAAELSPSIDWQTPAWVFAATAVFLLVYALRRKSRPVGYAVTGYLFAALACWLAAGHQTEFMLPLAALTGGFYLAGLGLLLTGRDLGWARVLRTSGLALGVVILFFLPNELQEKLRPGLALLLAGMLFLSEIHIRQGSWLEIPMDLLLALGYTRLLRLFVSGPTLPGYDLFGAALIVLGCDLYFTRRSWKAQPFQTSQRLALRVVGGVLAAACVLFFIIAEHIPARDPSLAFGLLAGFFLLTTWGYRQPRLGYLTFAFLAGSLFYWMRALGRETWLAPEIGLAVALYAGSFAFHRLIRPGSANAGTTVRDWINHPTWFEVLRLSGLGLAMLVSLSAPLEDSGLAASLWVAVAASLYAIEAFRLRNVWLGFPTNGLYLLAYFILLLELKVYEPQYFSVGVAVLGMLMHYLLVRSGSRLGAFITGLVSQLVLLGTTYIQMASTNRLSFFVMLFFQGLAVLTYGIIIRSRSLVLAPVVFIVVGVITVVLSVLSGIPTALIIGCTGVLLLALGILALVMRERLVEVSGRFGGWRA